MTNVESQAAECTTQAEALAPQPKQVPAATQLSELQLALVGGGSGNPVFM
jgi:hypothetical protein